MTFKTPAPSVRIVDKLAPEDEAMLQALYSRSASSVEEHLAKVAKTGSGKFMESYYVGYNHASIGDCGTTTLYFENVSTLAAKAIQDWPLYAGQETSTRYIDMSQQPIVDPVNTGESRGILQRWMTFYTENQTAVAEEVERRYPRRATEDEGAYRGAVKARTFDILRGFLPAGICTQLSWHTNLRQAKEHLEFLQFHPCKEISHLGHAAREQCHDSYGSSGFFTKILTEKQSWMLKVGEEMSYVDAYVPTQLIAALHPTTFFYDPAITAQLQTILRTRPRGMPLPHRVNALATFHATFPLDFGSFRDIQRHRAGITFMPLLTTKGGFEPWYVEQLPESLRQPALNLIEDQEESIERLGRRVEAMHERGHAVCVEDLQYYCALGHRVCCDVTYGLASMVYVTELRSTKFIHPTLRKVIRECAESIRPAMESYGYKYYADTSPDDWDVRRGLQTITEKT